MLYTEEVLKYGCFNTMSRIILGEFIVKYFPFLEYCTSVHMLVQG